MVTFQGKNGNLMPSPWPFVRRGQTGKPISSMLPHMAKHVDDIAFIHSMHSKTNTHGPGCIFMNTGHTTEGFPGAGAWCSHALGSLNENLPAYVAITDIRGETQIDRDVTLTEIDIENLIRAKGAIYSGCVTLLEEVGMSIQDLEQIILVGTAAPVSFFAYPGKDSWLVPEGCEVLELATVDHDTGATLQALAAGTRIAECVGEVGRADISHGNEELARIGLARRRSGARIKRTCNRRVGGRISNPAGRLARQGAGRSLGRPRCVALACAGCILDQ